MNEVPVENKTAADATITGLQLDPKKRKRKKRHRERELACVCTCGFPWRRNTAEDA